MTNKAYLAFDLGAESGRAMLGVLAGGKLELHELHRFANMPVRLPSGLHWNILELWGNVLAGLRKAVDHCRRENLELASLGVDTWGVDCGLLGQSGQLLGLPYAYREERFIGAMAKTIQLLGAEQLYDITGIQFLPFNTLFQVQAMQESEPAVLAGARRLMFLPDILHYFFTGVAINEATIASTSQMINPRLGGELGGWATELLAALGLPIGMLGPIAAPGTRIGPLRADVAAETGAPASLGVTAPACHDTASAVAAVPADPKVRSCYLSSGTWSLMGVELDEPRINESVRAANFTNERGVGGKIRFLKNGAGLWLVQQVRRSLAQQGHEYDYQALTDLAAKAPPFRTLVDSNHGPFGSAGGMIEKVHTFARSSGQPLPQTPGELTRSCLEGLALSYRQVLGQLEELVGYKVEVIHIVGGGGRNVLLNQMTADATGRTVVAGPFEATAAGNVLVQAMGQGDVGDLAQLRKIVAASSPMQTYRPKGTAAWDDANGRYIKLLARK